MPEPPVSPGAPPPIRDDDPVSGRVLTVDSPRPRSSIRVDDPVSGGPVSGIGSRPSGPGPRPIDHPRLGRGLPLPLQAIDPPRLEPRPRSSTPIDDPRPGRSRDIGSRPSGPGPRPSIRVHDSGSGHLSAIDPRPGPLPLPLPAINSRRPAPRPRLSIGDHDPGSRRVGNINSLPPAPRPRPSIRVDDPGSGRVRAVNARRPASRPRPLIRVDDGPGALGSCKPSAAPNKEAEEAQYEIQRLNELRLGEDISYEESRRYLGQLPHKTDVDTSTKLDAVQLKELNTRHALYRSKYYQLSYQVPEDYRPSRLEERGFSNSYEDGKLDWYFHPDYCKLAGLEDYQRLVPRNYGGYEYVHWDEYHKYFHSYEIEQEYIKYCEHLSKKLKWMEAYVPVKYPSLKWGMILTRGSYQAIKIATDFSMITGGLSFSGFYEWVDSMMFDVCAYNELDGVFYEIWHQYTNEKKFRDALDEVYELNRFPLRQGRMRSALENDTFCSDLEEEFLACTTCLKEFAEDKSQITEEKARELIAEALRKETQKPKLYEDYCRKKIDIARAIGLISS